MFKKVVIIFLMTAFLVLPSISLADDGGDDDLYPIPTFDFNPDHGRELFESLQSTPEPTPPPLFAPPPLLDVPDTAADPTPGVTPDPWDPQLTPIPESAFSFIVSSSASHYWIESYNGDSRVYRSSGGYSGSLAPQFTSFRWSTITNSGSFQTDFSANWATLRDSSELACIESVINIDRASSMPSDSIIRLNSRNRWLYAYDLLPTIDRVQVPDEYLSVTFNVRAVYPDFSSYTQTVSCTFSAMQQGISVDLPWRDGIRSIYAYWSISNSYPPLDDGSRQAIFLYSRNNKITSYDDLTLFPASPDNSEVDAINSQTNTIGGFFSSLFKGLLSIFIPDGDMIQDFINSKVSNPTESPLSPATVVVTRLLSIFANAPDDVVPQINFDGFMLSIGGVSYGFIIPPFSVDFSTIPENLLTYSRMIGDMWLCWAFMRYLARKIKSFYNVHFADTLTEVDSEDDSNPSMFD